MYAKLFTSIYQGTLRGNSHGLLVFTNLLAHADSAGIVDVHPRAICEEVGLGLDQVKTALEMLESPDEESRSPEMDGRRIIRVDEHRAWGWRIVNFLKYRAIRNEEDRREQNRAAQQRWREKNKPASAKSETVRDESAHTEAEAEAEADKEKEPTVLVGRADAYRVPDCPYEDLTSLYHELCPSLPALRVMTQMRLKHTQARWKQVCVADKATAADSLQTFRWYFERVEGSDFLTGRTGGKNGRSWRADYDWLMGADNFAKVIEGRYHGEKA